LETITAQDAAGWFTHCGYPPGGHSKTAAGEEAVS
jgi:hypothetical protein